MTQRQPWILVGMMGSGKSTIGKRLAELSQRDFKDTDALISARLGRTIEGIFNFYGEETFRQHETSILSGLPIEPYVLSTGGGIILREENRKLLKSLGTTIYLQVPSSSLIERLEQSKRKRPLLARDDWQAELHTLLQTRTPLYEQADIIISMEELSLEEATQVVYDRVKNV